MPAISHFGINCGYNKFQQTSTVVLHS